MKPLQPFLTLLFWVCYFSAFSQITSDSTFNFMQMDSMKNEDFSFWLGQWEVYQTGTDKLAGQSHIEGMLNGFAFRESYATPTGYHGTSYNTYNSTLKRWEQYYVDNGGTVLHIVGNLQQGSMVLSDCEADTTGTCNRISWTPQADGTVRQVWEQTQDKGATWSVLFDGTYFPKKE